MSSNPLGNSLVTSRRKRLAWRCCLAVGLVATVAGCGGAVAYGAQALPVLTVSTLSVPTNLAPGGTGVLRIDVRNEGDAPTDGSPVTIVDKLPPGITATESGVVTSGNTIQPGEWECSGATVVTCTSSPSMPAIVPLESTKESPSEGPSAPSIGIAVTIAPTAAGEQTNTVEASGGGVSEDAVENLGIDVSSSSPPFGLASESTEIINADGSPDLQAGSHPYSMTTRFTVNNVLWQYGNQRPAGNGIKTLEVDIPKGMVGDPLATPRCPRALFDVEQYVAYPADCPDDTQIGYDEVKLESDSFRTIIPVYNLVPPPGVPAQFGFAFQKDVGFIDAGVRTGEGYGLKVVVHNVVQLGLIANSLTLWGDPADHSHDARRYCNSTYPCESQTTQHPFLTNAGSCGEPQALTIDSEAWEGQTFSQEFPITNQREEQSVLNGCQRLAFAPTLTVQPDTPTADTPTGLNVDLHIPQTEGAETLATANLRDATVTLPAGMTVSPSGANGLQACTPEQIGLSNSNATACPEASKVGLAEVTTPLLSEPLKGSVYLAQQDNNPFGSLIALYLSVEGSGVLIKLAGNVELGTGTNGLAPGQIRTTFKDNPQLPFSDLKLTFFDGPRAPLATPSACGTYQTTSSLSSWSGLESLAPTDSFAITSGCANGFAPSFTAGTTNNQAGGYSPLVFSLSRQDGEQELQTPEVTLPRGLLAKLAGVPRCGEAEANAGTCSESSRIGSVTVAAGPGSDPYVVQGKIYLTGAYNGGPFGEVVEVPAVAGPFNLGMVVVRGSIRINPTTAQATVVSNPVPTILQGIPLQVKTVNITLERPGFSFNPSSCAALSVTGAITSNQNIRAGVSSPFEAANCANLPFKPAFTASTDGRASKAGGASLVVKVSSKGGPGVSGEEANIRSVKVDLPKQLPSRLSTLQKACLAKVFEANPANCPKESNVGTATAKTPVLTSALSGPAYLVSHGGEAFPDLEIVLQGEGVKLVLDGNTQIKKGITSSTFKTVPDAPISSFELTLPTGKYSILGANVPEKDKYVLCGQSLPMPTAITGQNGAVDKQTTKISVAGCAKRKALAKARKLKH